MSKKRSKKKSVTYATFRNLVSTLADQIGHHQIPIEQTAMHPAALITSDAIHYDIVKKLTRAIYRANSCYHLNAPIYFESTFDAIGEIYGDIVNSDVSDIDQVELVHQIGSVAAEFFKQYDSYPTALQATQSALHSSPGKGKVQQSG
ncbi:MAG: hypothetical protein OXI60_06575 [Acidiferrobacterales bacterium]|nr:hypothetical protein [Acidiferrobacterales bacterium]